MAAEITQSPTACADPYVVLLVEDEFLIRCDLADELRLLGYRVIEAGNADEAIEILRSTARIDLVVTDVRMPGLRDGVDVAQAAREERPGLRVILMSGHFAPKQMHEQLIDLFIAKPVPSDLLASKVVKLMKPKAEDPGV